jgi:membrane protein
VARARALGDRVLSAAGRHPSLEIGIAVVRRDIDVGGTLLAGALAFRLFVWLLPCSLLLTALLGFVETLARPPDELSTDLGMSPVTANLLGEVGAQAERGRYLTAIIGVVLLAWAGLLLGRAMDRVHERVWHHHVDRRPGPTLARMARYNGLLLLIVVGNAMTPVAVAALGWPAAVVSVPSLILYLVIGTVLLSPQWPPRWRTAWPGAVLIALGNESLHLVAVLYLPGKLARASELYGTLGVAAAVLLWLALVARLIVLGQELNAVLAERRR